MRACVHVHAVTVARCSTGGGGAGAGAAGWRERDESERRERGEDGAPGGQGPHVDEFAWRRRRGEVGMLADGSYAGQSECASHITLHHASCITPCMHEAFIQAGHCTGGPCPP